MKSVVVKGGFDDLRSDSLRFLEEAAKLGSLQVLLWSDAAFGAIKGAEPKFPVAERAYLLRALRFVDQVTVVESPGAPHELPELESGWPDIWVDRGESVIQARSDWARSKGMAYIVKGARELAGFPIAPCATASEKSRKRVVVTGCYDWLHSGHVRFFEEVSTYGELYVVVGHDENIRLLKGAGHPVFREQERRYMVGSVRYVFQAIISSGKGWLDADPEIQKIRPHLYAVNEDGDKGGKREYCEKMGIDYLVLKRTPAAGLPARSSTNLRGF